MLLQRQVQEQAGEGEQAPWLKTRDLLVGQTAPAFPDPETSLSLFPEPGETERQSPVNPSWLSGADSRALPLQQAASSLSGVI